MNLLCEYVSLNPLALRAAKTGLTNLLIFSSQKRFYQKDLKETCVSEHYQHFLLQILCENLLYFQVIFKSMKLADDTFLGNCEWVKYDLDFTKVMMSRCLLSVYTSRDSQNLSASLYPIA